MAERELLSQIGAETTFAQRLLVQRVVKMMFVAERLDAKLTDGSEWTPHDARTFGALNTAVTRGLRELGLKPAPKAKAPSLADIAARHAKPRAVAE